jgi:hypothetical protein
MSVWWPGFANSINLQYHKDCRPEVTEPLAAEHLAVATKRRAEGVPPLFWLPAEERANLKIPEKDLPV